MSIKLIACETYGSEKNICIITEDGNLTTKKEENKNFVKKGLSAFFKSAFLPQGYPESVSSDYLEYQLWDTMQAFCSSITGTLATRAVLKGYGVGDENATVAGATITWMLKDGAGMIGRILFAWLKGTQLDCDAKRWRLFADILNDLAILMDLIAPFFKPLFVCITCISSIARSIVGVAGGATRAALTLHQARRDNMADVSAKDGSQETLVNLMALLAGFMITPLVDDNQTLIWFFFFVFTYFHLFANYRAVSAVIMETINLPRLYIIMQGYFQNGFIMRPAEVSLVDPVIKKPGYTSKLNIGIQFHKVFKSSQRSDLLSTSRLPLYLISYSKNAINIALHQEITTSDIRKSVFHGLLIDMVLNNKLQLDNICKKFQLKVTKVHGNLIRYTQEVVNEMFPCFERELERKGWDLNRCHLGLDEWRFSWDKKSL